jgi:hypothetical protein
MKRLLATTITLLLLSSMHARQESFHFSTPLSSYNTDILSYLQVLHRNQQYKIMVPFYYGRNMSKSLSKRIR